MKYVIEVVYTGSITLEVEADSEEEAREYAESEFLNSEDEVLANNIYEYDINVEEDE